MVLNRYLLTNVTPNDRQDFLNLGEVQIGIGHTLKACGFGVMWPLGRVLLVPELKCNVISVKM